MCLYSIPVILKPTNGIADKVYLTSKDPSLGKREIARNNYDNPARGLWEKREAKGDVDVAIKLKIPESKLTVEDSNRDIITHKGAIEVDKYK